jgi:energy-coupling factor transporter ATP-binding protein EcfA2
MKLLELEIANVRGIRQVLLKPSGNNFVIWGPNGSGKSAVVDAIDFLLTGRISRLMGKGTGNINLNRHGPHVDCRPEDATVRAIIQIPGRKESIEIKRCFAEPNTLVCDESVLPALVPILDLAKRGQHVLTRREILRYITSDGGTRAQDIQDLLSITEIENIRKNLVKVQNEFKKDLQAAQRNLESARGAVNATVGQMSFLPETVLIAINQNRAILGAHPITILSSTELKASIKLPAATTSNQSINVTLLEGDIANIKNALSDQNKTEVFQIDNALRSLIVDAKSKPELLTNLSRQELTALGMKLLDDGESCPLCDISWPPGKLREYLEKKTNQAKIATQYQTQASQLSTQLAERIASTISSVQKVIAAAQIAGFQAETVFLTQWQSNLKLLSDALSKVFDKYPLPAFDSNATQQLLAPPELLENLADTYIKVKEKFPETTPEQTAWDTLTRLEENLKALEKSQTELANALIAYTRANTLVDEFERSRDSVLQKLYDEIRDRFVGLYKQLHGSDEESFQAQITPDGAALNLEVDFYGRGPHPPHALHSEGHQDSMGLCLYLALAERLTGGFIEITILDDVVMSVDADHRRELCRLISSAFPQRQFLITTHDKTWASQLRSENVVKSRGSIEFYNWNVNTGPQVNYEADCWEKIKGDLERNDISSAAARLRRASEQYFGLVCDSLHAPVTFKLSGRWELGDFMPSAVGQYRRLLVKAKEAAQSWNNKELLHGINEVDTIVGQIYARTNAEQWAVNANVHYNNWANFERKDFLPVVDAFQDLFALFTCSTCGKILDVPNVGMKSVAIKCDCGAVNWNLVAKEK